MAENLSQLSLAQKAGISLSSLKRFEQKGLGSFELSEEKEDDYESGFFKPMYTPWSKNESPRSMTVTLGRESTVFLLLTKC